MEARNTMEQLGGQRIWGVQKRKDTNKTLCMCSNLSLHNSGNTKKTRTDQISSQGTLIDTGCTRCLMRKVVAVELGLQATALQNLIVFEQMDGSTLGGGSGHYTLYQADEARDRSKLGVSAFRTCRQDD